MVPLPWSHGKLGLGARHYSPRTAEAHRVWVKRFVYFHRLRRPTEMGEPEINSFHTHLAVADKVSVSTQNQALSALLFLYRHVLQRKGVVRDGKGGRDRVTMLPASVKDTLRDHLREAKRTHDGDLAASWGRVLLPDALDRTC